MKNPHESTKIAAATRLRCGQAFTSKRPQVTGVARSKVAVDRGFFCHDVDGVAAGHRVVARPAILSADEGSRRRQVNL